MNKLILSLSIGLLLAACQNTPQPAAPAAPAPLEAPASTVLATPQSLEQASASLSSSIQLMEDLKKKVEALPAPVKKAKSAEIDGIRANLDGMLEKQAQMMKEIKAASTPAKESATASEDSPGSGGLNAATVQDYNESAVRYAKDAQALQESISKLGAPKQ